LASIRHPILHALLGALALLVFAAPAQAKQAKLDGQLIAAAATKGSKVTAPILLTEKSAKKLKLRSPLATLTIKASRTLPAPSPTGQGTVQISPSTLRAGDALVGKAKRKGKGKALMPMLAGSKLTVTSRESRYSVEELTDALTALYGQVSALGLRVDALESGLATLQAQLDQLRRDQQGLQDEIDSLITQITNLQGLLDDLTNVVNGLPTMADLQAALAAITQLQADLDTLEALIPGLATDAELAAVQTALQGQITTINGQLTTITGQVNGLIADVNVLCGLPIVGGVCP
jgi:uncharacterized phage infection (PIP) family protein YhgE